MTDPTEAEFKAAGRWLEKHDVPASRLTPLLVRRLGVRAGARPGPTWTGMLAGLLLIAFGSFAVQFLSLLPGVDHDDLPEGRSFFCLFAGLQLVLWLPVRWADRRTAAWLGPTAPAQRPPWRGVLNGWSVAALVVTFGGGAALAVTMVVSSGSVWALLWLGLLALGAVVVAAVLLGVLTRPVLADDELSRSVDGILRRTEPVLALPAFYALPVLADLATTNRQPPGFAPWLIAYVVLAVGAQAAGLVRHRRRALPAAA